MWADGDVEVVKAIKRDFVGEWGDRRQEIVFIGGGEAAMSQSKVEKLLDTALLNDKEWAQWQKIMKSEKYDDDEKEDKLLDLFKDGLKEDVTSPRIYKKFISEDTRKYILFDAQPTGGRWYATQS
ncbi:unnamed protein product [Rhizoctonia solani]|uniref:CobW C-terminal domain-containing protein n=1 Tax=Rhizoctonia solani TaxID=456999 RepID=A0A8H3GKK5_9AGAM|nr:unnamed protein product [Rhizoctonia solani]